MHKKDDLLIIGAEENNTITPEQKSREIARWFSLYYSHTTENRELIKEAKKKTKSKKTYEKDDKIYLVP